MDLVSVDVGACGVHCIRPEDRHHLGHKSVKSKLTQVKGHKNKSSEPSRQLQS